MCFQWRVENLYNHKHVSDSLLQYTASHVLGSTAFHSLTRFGVYCIPQSHTFLSLLHSTVSHIFESITFQSHTILSLLHSTASHVFESIAFHSLTRFSVYCIPQTYKFLSLLHSTVSHVSESIAFHSLTRF